MPAAGMDAQSLVTSRSAQYAPQWSLASLVPHLPAFNKNRALSFQTRQGKLLHISARNSAVDNSPARGSLDNSNSQLRIRNNSDSHGLDRNPPLPPSRVIMFPVTWLFMLFYRALLVGSIGLAFCAPAAAKPAIPLEKVVNKNASQKIVDEKAREAVKNNVHKVLEKIVEEDEPSLSHDQKEGNVSTKDSDSSCPEALGEDFWKSIDCLEGSTEEALKDFLTEHPSNVEALEVLMHLLLEKEDMTHALKVLEKLELLEPEEMEWKYMRAEVYDVDGQHELARKGFEDILKVEPSSIRALQGLLVIMDESGESQAALEMIEACVAKAQQEDNIEDARGLRMLIGQFQSLKGNLGEALEIYQRLIDEDPKDFRPYFCQGIVYSSLGDKVKAEQQFKMYKKLCPKDFPGKEFADELISRAKKGEKLYHLGNPDSGNAKEGDETETSEQS